jgi:hypothetical protein
MNQLPVAVVTGGNRGMGLAGDFERCQPERRLLS